TGHMVLAQIATVVSPGGKEGLSVEIRSHRPPLDCRHNSSQSSRVHGVHRKADRRGLACDLPDASAHRAQSAHRRLGMPIDDGAPSPTGVGALSPSGVSAPAPTTGNGPSPTTGNGPSSTVVST